MQKLFLGGGRVPDPAPDNRIYCPAIEGLTPRQADLSFVMPRMDHNHLLREIGGQGGWAAILASDPFGSSEALFRDLRQEGYKGVANWPSSILLEGTTRETMATIPATPEFEYDFLATAQTTGFETLAFFLSLNQARAALSRGLKRLVLHPGFLRAASEITPSLVIGSFQRVIETLKAEDPAIEVLVYSSAWHENQLKLSTLDADGMVWLEDAA